MSKGERLASEIELQIANGNIQPGEKLGSIREVSRHKGVAVNTVLRAYELLEDQGLIVSRPQSGFYSLGPRPGSALTAQRNRVRAPKEITIPNLVSLVFESARDEDTIPFGAAYLDADLYPSESISKLTRLVFRDQPDIFGRYEWPPGSFEFRRQVSRRLEKAACFVEPSEIVTTNGATDALLLALRAVCTEGDTVLIESPQYFGVLQALHHLRFKVVEIPTHPAGGADLKQIEDALRKFRISAAVFIANFSNPMGFLMSEEKKAALVELFSRHDVPIVEDNIYADLSFTGVQPKPLKAYDKVGNVLTCSSYSKTISPAMRVGWLAPGRYGKAVRDLQLSTTTSVNALSQEVISRYLASRECEKHLRTLQLHCLTQTERFSQAVLSGFPNGTRVRRPSGGFVLWVELPKEVDSVELFRKALDEGISIAPGTMFSAGGSYRNYIRLSCGTRWTPRVEQALALLGRYTHTLSRRYA